MAKALDAIPTKGRSVEDVVGDVKRACKTLGVEVACYNSEKSKGAGARVTVYGLKCKHGMTNRQGQKSAATTCELGYAVTFRRLFDFMSKIEVYVRPWI